MARFVGISILLLLGSWGLSAGTFTFVTPSGSSTSGGPVSAEADFTTGSGSLTITLKNLQANPTDVAQAISDLSFSVSGGTGGSLSSYRGSQISIDNSGHASAAGTASNVSEWPVSFSGGVFHLDRLAAPGQKDDLIIGPAGAGGVYTNANGSIAGNGPHNPFIDQSATFTLSVTGGTASSTISNVVFSFGTTSGINVSGVPLAATPEPSAIVLLASTIALLLVRRLRARNQV